MSPAETYWIKTTKFNQPRDSRRNIWCGSVVGIGIRYTNSRILILHINSTIQAVEVGLHQGTSLRLSPYRFAMLMDKGEG